MTYSHPQLCACGQTHFVSTGSKIGWSFQLAFNDFCLKKQENLPCPGTVNDKCRQAPARCHTSHSSGHVGSCRWPVRCGGGPGQPQPAGVLPSRPGLPRPGLNPQTSERTLPDPSYKAPPTSFGSLGGISGSLSGLHIFWGKIRLAALYKFWIAVNYQFCPQNSAFHLLRSFAQDGLFW